MPSAMTKAWISRNGVPGNAAFSELLLTELGNQQHLDRLTIMLVRPNQRKRRMFQGERIVIDDDYKKQTQQEQLLAAKEVVLYRQISEN
ncbi:hypothetical protein MKX08_005111 [Trichoderma sp. CBMAI-0020]|nr:hypothetical protein MKX08_005111 [Trichoderma sp. CBMAI-0020]